MALSKEKKTKTCAHADHIVEHSVSELFESPRPLGLEYAFEYPATQPRSMGPISWMKVQVQVVHSDNNKVRGCRKVLAVDLEAHAPPLVISSPIDRRAPNRQSKLRGMGVSHDGHGTVL